MAKTLIESMDNITVIRVFGVLTFDEFVTAVKEHYPFVTSNIIWDFSDSNLDGITTDQLMRLPPIAKLYMINRMSGKTAFISPDQNTCRLLSTYVLIAEVSGIRFKSNVFTNFNEALKWLE